MCAYKTCIICGRQFACSPSAQRVTCSPSCSRVHRQQLGSTPEMADKLADMRAIYKASAGPGDWSAAKGWVLQAPGGAVYECVNLLQFFRAHPGLIETSPETAARGIVTVKRSLTGKRRRNPCTHWRGWTLLAWDDRGIKDRSADPAPARKYGETIRASFAARVRREGEVKTRLYVYFVRDGQIFRRRDGIEQRVYVAGESKDPEGLEML